VRSIESLGLVRIDARARDPVVSLEPVGQVGHAAAFAAEGVGRLAAGRDGLEAVAANAASFLGSVSKGDVESSLRRRASGGASCVDQAVFLDPLESPFPPDPFFGFFAEEPLDPESDDELDSSFLGFELSRSFSAAFL